MYSIDMKKALLALSVMLLAALVSVPVDAVKDTISCSDYTGREKTACNNGKSLPNAFDTQYCSRYTSATQIEACENGQYIGSYNYDMYCSQFGTNYSACMMPTASSAPIPESDTTLGVVAPKGASSGDECSSVSFDFNENCSQTQKILKAMNFALPVVYILGIAGIVFGVLMRVRLSDWKQQKQGTILAWAMAAILVAYTTAVLMLNIVTPGGVLFELW